MVSRSSPKKGVKGVLLPALRLQSLNPNLAKILLSSPPHRGPILILYPKRNPPMCVDWPMCH